MLQDVDARLTKDVERLSDGMSKLIPSMVKPVVDIAWFTAQLARLTGLRGMGILYSYALIGLVLLRLVTPDFGALAKQVSKMPDLRAASECLKPGNKSLHCVLGIRSTDNGVK